MVASLRVDRLVLLSAALLGFACGAPGSQGETSASQGGSSESGAEEGTASAGATGESGGTSMGGASADEGSGGEGGSGSEAGTGDETATAGETMGDSGSDSDGAGSSSTGGEPTLCDEMADKFIECNPQYAGARGLVVSECEGRRDEAAAVSEECAAAADELIACASMLECPDLPDTVGCEAEREAVDAACEQGGSGSDGGSSTGA